MEELTVKNVNLFGDTVVAAQDHDGTVWAGVRWVCDGLGLTRGQTNNESSKIKDDLVLQKGARNLMLPTNGGNQKVLCLRNDYVPLWIAKITITPSMKKNNPELVDKLVKYQLEAKDVLAAAFLTQEQAPITYQYAPSAATFDAAANLGRLIERVMKAEGACPHEIALALKPIFQQAGIDIRECFVKLPAYEQLMLSGLNY